MRCSKQARVNPVASGSIDGGKAMKGLAFLQIKVGVIDKRIPEPGPNDAGIKTTVR